MQWQILRKCGADALRKKIFIKPKARPMPGLFYGKKLYYYLEFEIYIMYIKVIKLLL